MEHSKKRHGLCKDCGHYGDDCTGSTTKHTPTPWIPFNQDELRWIDEALKKDGRATPFRKAVIRAVNSHEELVEALAIALPYMETALEDEGYKPGVVDRKVKWVRALIAKAEGR